MHIEKEAAHWERFRALHYDIEGAACLWFAVEPVSGRLFIYREHVPEEEVGAGAFAHRVVAAAPTERYSYTVGNAELFTGSVRGLRLCDVFEWAGVPCEPAQGDVASRTGRVLDYQEPAWVLLPDMTSVETPHLLIFPQCVQTRRVLGGAMRDSDDPCVLAVSYGAASRPVHEARRVDPAAERLRWAEEGTRDREKAREKVKRC